MNERKKAPKKSSSITPVVLFKKEERGKANKNFLTKYEADVIVQYRQGG